MQKPGYVTSLLLAGALALPLMSGGCAEHRYSRVYDPYRQDYHRWTPDEDSYYHRWETDNRREHREWAQRSPEEQREYWTWRHANHGGRDHDRDHDRDKH